MSYIIHQDNIKLEIQAVGVEINEGLHQQLLKLIRKLKNTFLK
jgi:hypothetical protein